LHRWFFWIRLASIKRFDFLTQRQESRLQNKTANKSLQATRDGALSSATRFTSFGPACLSSGR
jgi:hypothetical protein